MSTTTDLGPGDEERCVACDRSYDRHDGWQGLCPSCGALVDEHDAGRHRRLGGGLPAGACLACLAAGSARPDLDRLTA